MTHETCHEPGCERACAPFGAGRYQRHIFCPGHYADWYGRTIAAENADRAAVLPTVPAQPHLNPKVSEGTCRWCQEPIWWRRRHDGGRPYPAEPTSDSDRGHRCPSAARDGSPPLVGLTILAVLVLAAWVPGGGW